MNKPPERIYFVESKRTGEHYTIQRQPYDHEEVLAKYDRKKPMTQKTESLTTQEAWAAMARGECVQTGGPIFKIFDVVLRFWNGENWIGTTTINEGPYSIVPDPSKPKEVKSNYQEQVMAIDAMLKRGEYKNAAACILTYVDSLYLRKP